MDEPTLYQNLNSLLYATNSLVILPNTGIDPSQIMSGTQISAVSQNLGNLASGKVTFSDTEDGYWLGIDKDGIPKFNFGNSTNYISFDGSTVTIYPALNVGSLNIPDLVTANSFHVDSTGNAWWGSILIAGATAKILNTGVSTFTNVSITGGAISGTPISGIPNNTITDISLLGFTQNIVFTSASATQINWSSGIITMSNARTFSISARNTGTMGATTYIYLDPAISITVLQTTTTFSTAVGANKILIATAQNNTNTASVVPFGGGQPVLDGTANISAGSITANSIAASTITAGLMNVSTLSAITANMGSITAGTITLDTSGYVRGGQTDYNTGTGFFLGYSGAAYKFSIGNPAGNYLTWDGSTLTIVGAISSNIGLNATLTVAVSANLRWSNDANKYSMSDSFVLIKEILLNEPLNVSRIKFDMCNFAVDGTTAHAQIYKNGVAIGTDQTSVNNYFTKSQDFASLNAVAGDKIQVYGHGTSGGGVNVMNFELFFDKTITAFGNALYTNVTLVTPLAVTAFGTNPTNNL